MIPTSGFYEWKKSNSGVKQPFYFYLKDKDVFGFAGANHKQQIRVERFEVNDNFINRKSNFIIEGNMSEEESKSAPTDAPVMDDETYAFVQEVFQLARAGDAERLKEFLEIGLAPNIRDGKGNSLLMLASYNGNFVAARVLLEHGGDPELANDSGQIPLAGCAFKGDTEMARLLIENGADVNAPMPDGKTALMFAAMFNRTEIIDLLLKHGADSSLQSSDGMTALSLAQKMEAQAAVERLSVVKEQLL